MKVGAPLEGWFLGRVTGVHRMLLAAGVFSLVKPRVLTGLFGVGLFVLSASDSVPLQNLSFL